MTRRDKDEKDVHSVRDKQGAEFRGRGRESGINWAQSYQCRENTGLAELAEAQVPQIGSKYEIQVHLISTSQRNDS